MKKRRKKAKRRKGRGGRRGEKGGGGKGRGEGREEEKMNEWRFVGIQELGWKVRFSGRRVSNGDGCACVVVGGI